MELSQIRWKDFTQEALSASAIAEYFYCQAKLVMQRQIGDIENGKMTEGKMLHEKKAQDNLSQFDLGRASAPELLADAIEHSKMELTKALEDRVPLENPKDGILFAAVVPNLRLWGKPDRADCTNGEWPIIIDYKFTEKLPTRPWPNDKVQLGVYMLGIETLGFKPLYGFLEYNLRDKKDQSKIFKVDLDEELRKLVRSTAESARRIIDGQQEPMPDSPRKCQRCEYHECKWKLQ